jgi:DNA-binding MarR family transcriptional regulator
LAENEAAARLERACSAAATGRRAARALAAWTKRFGLNEAEFQLLWGLRPASTDVPSQINLASTLAFSPAQVSAVVERMRQQGLICEREAIGDRRRHHWQLSPSGQLLLDRMLTAAALPQFDSHPILDIGTGASRSREAAA